MKRCPKCNRTFPEDSQKFCTVDGGLLITEQNFDPNVTIRATSSEMGLPEQESPLQPAPTSRELPDLGATIAIPSAASAGTPRPTSPASPSRIQISSDPLPSPQPAPRAPARVTGSLPEKKKSKLPLILGILAVLLILGVAGIAAAFFFVIKPRLDEMQGRPVVVRENPPAEVTNTNSTIENTNTATPDTATVADEYVPPADATKFANSKDNLDGKLADHYVDFSFYYPSAWQTDPKAGVAGANNFARVERALPPDYTQEEFAVSWYGSAGTYESDLPNFPKLVELLSSNLAKRYPEYRKVSEGPTKINSADAYEFRFVSFSKGTDKGDIQIWGRIVFLPTGIAGATSGATLSMLGTSLAPELSSVEDVGDKGQMPVILESFRFAKN